ncbi:MAG: DUF1684 domain-containing protein [Alphaproteobacteria bacterium]|nr:DUF1684 domain-containing protein [Alphaproteobacteria bacterium]
MRRTLILLVLPLFLAAPPLLLAAAPLAPKAQWEKDIADQNVAYSQKPHAMLKIQDSVYLGEGESAVLIGVKGKPASWKWESKPGAKGPLLLAVKGGKLNVSKDGKPVDPKLVSQSVPVDTDVDVAGFSTQVSAGVLGYRVFVYNQKNPDALTFKGVSYFPYDPAFRVTARFTPDAKLPPRVFKTSRGTDKQFFHAGDAAFMLKGKQVTLPFYTDSHDPKQVKDMSAFFRDDLTNNGAYGAGRYVDIADFGAFPPKTIAIDFNEAYNPNCARSRHYTCPLAVDVIPLAMKAGEKDPHFKH